MNILIQNNSDSALYVPIRNEGDSSIDRTVMLTARSITTVSDEVYFKHILKNPFFKEKFEDGTIRALNGEQASEQNLQNAMGVDLAYNKYTALMKKINDAGGIQNKELKPYLNADGTPMLSLLHANYGRNIDPQTADQFRARYTAEANEGFHENTLKLPGGMKMEVPASDVDIEEEENDAVSELEELSLEELKEEADRLGVKYPVEIEREKLIKKIAKRSK